MQRRSTRGWFPTYAPIWRLVALLLAACAPALVHAQQLAELDLLPPLTPELPAKPITPREPIAPGELVVPAEPQRRFVAESILPEPVDGEIVALGEPSLEGTVEPPLAPTTLPTMLGYNTSTGRTAWIIGDDDRFGMVSLESSATLPAGESHGIVLGMGFHFLDGPVVTDMPPRLFDLVLGYQRRRWISPNVGYDVVARVGVFTDFEGSARDGVRFPGHAVVQFRTTRDSEWLIGVDVLDRDDVSLLPVIGFRWAAYDELRLDLVFPRPCLAVRLPDADHWAYLRGELGGGTWAIERVDLTSDNATYRDLRLAFGVEDRSDPAGGAAVEIAYLFGRELTYRSGNGDLDLKDAVMLSVASTY